MQESTGTRLRDALEEDIASGRYKPGERLDEVSLSNRFGVSRTPVREALVKLASSGMVEMKPRRGAFVRKIGLRGLIEMFEVMAELEAMCGRLAARRIDTGQRQRLLAAHEACIEAEAAGDADAYYYRNETFHARIYEACGNRFLREQTEHLRNRLKPYRRMQLHVPQRMSASLHEHQRIVDAILAGDEETVDRELKAHVLIQGERFTDFLARLTEDVGDAVSEAG